MAHFEHLATATLPQVDHVWLSSVPHTEHEAMPHAATLKHWGGGWGG